jgi:hypothetical protein
MHKEMAAIAASGATSGVGVVSSWWLWLTDPNSAHVVTAMTLILIVSQLIWGWRKFFKEAR